VSSVDLPLGGLLLLFGKLLLLLEQSLCAFLARHSILVGVNLKTSGLSGFVGNCTSFSRLLDKGSNLSLLRLGLSNLFQFFELLLLLGHNLCLNLRHGLLGFEGSLLNDSVSSGFLGAGLLLSNRKNLLGFDDGDCRGGRFPEFLKSFSCLLLYQLLFGCLDEFSFLLSFHELSLDLSLHFLKFLCGDIDDLNDLLSRVVNRASKSFLNRTRLLAFLGFRGLRFRSGFNYDYHLLDDFLLFRFHRLFERFFSISLSLRDSGNLSLGLLVLESVHSGFDGILDKVVSLCLYDRHSFGGLGLHSSDLALSDLSFRLRSFKFSEVLLLEVLNLLFMRSLETGDGGKSSCFRSLYSSGSSGFSSFLGCDDSLNDTHKLFNLFLSDVSILLGSSVLALHGSDHRLQFLFKQLLFDVADLSSFSLHAECFHHLVALLVANS